MTGNKSFLCCPHYGGHSAGLAPRHRLGPVHSHICAGKGQLALSHPGTLQVLGWIPLSKRLRKPRAVVAGRWAFALLSQPAHAPPCVRSATHAIEERRDSMESSPDDVPFALRARNGRGVQRYVHLGTSLVLVFVALASHHAPLWSTVCNARPCARITYL